MVKLYKTFLAIGIALICVFANQSAIAADPIFTVESIEVDVTAENAIKAREQAFEEAQIKAFEELASRMLPEQELAALQPPEPLTISTLIQDFELLNEKLSAVRYIGAYTFRFKDTAVRRYFSQSETTFSDVSSRSMLVLPFLQRGSASTLWSPFNDWMKAWNRAPQNRGAIPLRLPIGDLQDVQVIEDNQALSYNPQDLQNMLERYGASEAVIAIALPDDALHNIENPNQTAQGRLSVEIYRTDRGRPELVQQVNAIANGVQSKAQLYDTAVLRVKAALKDDWKARTMVRSPAQNRIAVKIPITGLGDWVALQRDLKRVQGIEDVSVKSLSANEVSADLLFQGDSQRLLLSLQQNGLTIERMTAPDGRAANILRASRYKPVRF